MEDLVSRLVSVCLKKGVTSAYVVALGVLITILAPGRPAFAQGESEFVGDHNEVDNEKSFTLFGLSFDFGRVIAADGTMGRSTQTPPPPAPASNLAFVHAGESKEITLFSKATSLMVWGATASATTPGGFESDFNLTIFPGDERELVLASGGPGIEFKEKKIKLIQDLTVSVSPVFTLKHDFGTVKIMGVDHELGEVSIDFKLDASVVITEKADGKMQARFQATGVDLIGKISFSTSAKVDRSISVVKVGLAGLKIEPKVVGEAKVDVGNSDYDVDAHPTYAALSGKATSNIQKMKLEIGGKIKADVTFTLGVEFNIGEINIADLPTWELNGPASNKVLYNK